jgi:glycosyltransferase involved in cell wall biosynthesis
MADALTLIIPVHNAGTRLEPALREWSRVFEIEPDRDIDIVVVNDGGTDESVEKLAISSFPRLRVIKHESRQGFGACLRTALSTTTHPIVAYVSLDYPYRPTDLKTLLERLGKTAPIYDRELIVEAISGCRTGREAPAFWKLVGLVYRTFCRVVLGAGGEKIPGWLGFREHARAWALWLTMGVPLHDPNSAFKVFRRSLFDRFPIQSDGDFVHAEIFAKLTFLSVLVDETLLTPDPSPPPHADWRDCWTVLTDAKFHSPLPDRTRHAVSGA